MMQLTRFIFAATLVIAAGLALSNCGGSKPATQTGDGPSWWLAQPLPQREYIAELYRVSVAIAVMEEEQLHFLQQWRSSNSEASNGYDSLQWRTVLNDRRIAGDRARLALRLASGESAKWLKQFLAMRLESNPILPTTPNEFAKALDSLVRLSIDPTPEQFVIRYEPGRTVALKLAQAIPEIVLWELQVSPNASLTTIESGFGGRILPEPKEDRSPMGKLLASSWIVPPDAEAKEQVTRWQKMVETEFDNAHWKLGGKVGNEAKPK